MPYIQENWTRTKLTSKKILLLCGVSAFFLAGLVSMFFATFDLKTYQYSIQSELFSGFFFVSFFLLFRFALKREWTKALMFFLLPLLVYDLINYTTETILYATHIYSLNASAEVFALRNINLSLGDLKVGLVTLSLIVWIWVYKKVVS